MATDLIFPITVIIVFYFFYRYFKWKKKITWHVIVCMVAGVVLGSFIFSGHFDFFTIFVCMLLVMAFIAARMPEKRKRGWMLDGEFDDEK